MVAKKSPDNRTLMLAERRALDRQFEILELKSVLKTLVLEYKYWRDLCDQVQWKLVRATQNKEYCSEWTEHKRLRAKMLRTHIKLTKRRLEELGCDTKTLLELRAQIRSQQNPEMP